MLESGMPIDIVDKYGYTALMGAAMYNRTDVVRCLIEKGANVNEQNRYGWTALHTALHWASSNNYTDVIEILVQHGARTDIMDEYGETPIDLAHSWNYKEAVDLLQQY